MKILLCKWEAYMQEDLQESLIQMGHEVQSFQYHFEDIYEDNVFEEKITKMLFAESYDAVMTMNYFPVIAKICGKLKMPYISWIYDSPFDVKNPEETLGLSTNHLFFFDRHEYMNYRNAGFDTVYHMPLAVNGKRLDEIIISEKERKQYSCDISFVGSLYSSLFLSLYASLDAYEQGYLNALLDGQSKLYGCYFLREALSTEFLKRSREKLMYLDVIAGESEENFKKWMERLLACEITRRERMTIVSLLGSRNQVKLFSENTEEMLNHVEYCGMTHNYQQTPKVYKCSKINLNISLKQIVSGIPMRVMDVLGAGGFLLTNYQPEIAEHFVDGRDLVIYESIEDAVMKAEYYLAHEDERKQIAANGRKAVEKFSYENQLTQILEKVQ